MKEKLIELAQYMRDNNEPYFCQIEDVESVKDAVNYCWFHWNTIKAQESYSLLGRAYLDFKVNFVLQLAESL